VLLGLEQLADLDGGLEVTLVEDGLGKGYAQLLGDEGGVRMTNCLCSPPKTGAEGSEVAYASPSSGSSFVSSPR